MSDNEGGMDDQTPAPSLGPAAVGPKPKSFGELFGAKNQQMRQAAAAKAELEKRKAEAEAAMTNSDTSSSSSNSSSSSSTSKSSPAERGQHFGIFGGANADEFDINSAAYEGNVISFGRTAEQAQEAEEERLRAKENMPWTEKYRPESLSDVISHGAILSTLDSLISKGALPHVLFYGPAGSGKTSTALALARKLNAVESGGNTSTANAKRMVLELNASDERGIDTVRDKIKSFASSRQLFQDGTKLVILDEADSMTRTAQFALRRVIEKYTRTTRFCIIANYVNKIIPALQSRCTCFRFGPLDDADIFKHLTTIAQKENLELDPQSEGLRAVIKLAGGDMRKCLNIMQACKAAYNKLDEEAVFLCTGAPAPKVVRQICNDLFNLPFAEAYANIQQAQVDMGLSLVDLIESLHELLLRLSLHPKALAFLLPRLADIERALSLGTNEKLQLASLVGAFVIMRQITVKENEKSEAAAATSTTTTSMSSSSYA